MTRPRPPATTAPGPAPAPAADDVEDHRRHGLRDGLDGLRDLMERLLGADGCPWDRAQSLGTLRPYLIEEAYEVLESMDDAEAHRRELGDLLFQIVFQSALREREGAFDLAGVIEAIRSKMIRRHPHVFGERRGIDSAAAVERQWAELKASERAAAEEGPADPLAGVPRALPALQRAWRLQDKAAAVGFDWPDLEGPRQKAIEEWHELEEARASGDKARITDELGDLLFVLVRYGQKMGVAAEDALRSTNAKFEARFAHMMRRAHEAALSPQDAGLERLDGWWNEAKALGHRGLDRQQAPTTPEENDR